MWRYVNSYADIRATQLTVRLIMNAIDSEGIRLRSRNRLRRRQYVNPGPNYVIHVDGYDKLKPFGFPIHGAIDGYSRKILWLKLGSSNNNPKRMAYYFVNYMIIKCKVVRKLLSYM